MGLLKLLTFPVSGPVSAGGWLLRTVLDEAERQYFDEAAIAEQIAEVERRFEAGDIDAESFEHLHEALLQRLLEAREHHQTRAADNEA